jgi:hypothetical protein
VLLEIVRQLLVASRDDEQEAVRHACQGRWLILPQTLSHEVSQSTHLWLVTLDRIFARVTPSDNPVRTIWITVSFVMMS